MLLLALSPACAAPIPEDVGGAARLHDEPARGSDDVTDVASGPPVKCFDDPSTDTGGGDCAVGYERCEDGAAYQVECRDDATIEGMACECYKNGARVAAFDQPTKACLPNVGWLNERCGFSLAVPDHEPPSTTDVRAQLAAASIDGVDLDLHLVARDAWGAWCVDVDGDVGPRAVACEDAGLDCRAGHDARFGASACTVAVEDGSGVERLRVEALPDGVYLLAVAASGAAGGAAMHVGIDLVLAGRAVERFDLGGMKPDAFLEVATIEKAGAAFVVDRFAASCGAE